MVALKYVVFLGSVRENRLADRICKFNVSKLDDFNHEVSIMGEHILILTLYYCQFSIIGASYKGTPF